MHWWVLDSHMAAVRRGDQLEWLLVSPTLARMVAAMLLAGAGLLLLRRFGASRRAPDAAPARWAAAVRAVGLLTVFAWSLTPVACLATTCGAAGHILTYLFVDLRWWFTGAVAAVVLWPLGSPVLGGLSAAAPRGTGPSRFGHHVRRRRLEYLTACAAAAAALATSPAGRFDTTRMTGDEPKYMRHAENLLQGNGFDMSRMVAHEAVRDAGPGRLFQSVAGIPSALLDQIADARIDLAARLSGRREGASGFEALPNWFVIGRDGGTYQVHSPGLAMLMLPAYAVDRAAGRADLPETTSDGREYFPRRLTYSSLALLAIYAAWAGVAVWFFRQATGRDGLALALTAATILTLPVAPFNYQFYPEVPAGLVVMLVAGYFMFGRRGRFVYDIAAGAAIGCLPWLHVRFSILTLVFLAWAAVRYRRDRSHGLAFLGGCIALLLPLGLYTYAISGSFLPTSIYTGRRVRPFYPQHIVRGLMGYAFDRHFGIVANAPIFLVALPGLARFLRRYPAAFALAASLIVLSAGHLDWRGGSSGPSRLIVAVVPLLGLSMACAYERFGKSAVFRVLAALLLVISLDNMVAYGPRSFPRLVLSDESVSGWKMNLLFPPLLRHQPSSDGLTRSAALLFIGLVALPGLSALLQRRMPRPRAAIASPLAVFSTAIGVFVVVATVMTESDPRAFDRLYLDRPGRSVRGAARVYLARGCFRCFSTWPDQTAAIAGVDRLTVTTSSPEAKPSEVVTISVSAAGPASQPAWGELSLDFGDGHVTPPERIVGSATFTHAYVASRVYDLTVVFRAPDGSTVRQTLRQRVGLPGGSSG